MGRCALRGSLQHLLVSVAPVGQALWQLPLHLLLWPFQLWVTQCPHGAPYAPPLAAALYSKAMSPGLPNLER